MHVCVAMNVLDFLLGKGCEPGKIALLNRYHRQYVLYTRVVSHLQTKYPAIDLRGIIVAKFDTFQSKETTYAIVDMVRTSGLVSLAEANRIIVAVSRVKDGMVIIANFHSM